MAEFSRIMPLSFSQFVISTISICWLSIGHCADFELRVFSEQYPPFNYVEHGEAQGLSYEVFLAVLDELGRDDLAQNVEFVPWARGYQITQTAPNTLLFSTVRNPEREALFQWVGPIISVSQVLIGQRSRFAQGTDSVSVEELTRLSIGAVNDDIGELILKRHTLLSQAHREVVTFPDQAARMLSSGRIDLWSYGLIAARYILGEQGEDVDNYEVIYQFDDSVDLYFAFNVSTSPEVIEAFQLALNKIKSPTREGELSRFETILQRYHFDD